MTRYEFATIYLFRGIGGGTILNLPDGSEQKFAANMTEVTRVLNFLGREGWQLVSGGAGAENIWTLQRAL